MVKIIEKYRIIIITVFLLFCCLFVDSPFHGYYPPFVFIFLSTVSISLFYLIPSDKLILAEKIIYSFIVSILALFIGATITEQVLGTIYGYDSNFYDELQSPPILENLLFYFSTNFFNVGIFAIWMKHKKSIYETT